MTNNANGEENGESCSTQPGRSAPSERGRPPLIRYVSAALLARGADAGAAVGFVMLASASGAPAAHGALMAAALTAPHVFGSLPSRLLDRAKDARTVLAGAAVLYGLCIWAAALGFGRLPLAIPLLLAAAAGFCGPLLTGGLSSLLAPLMPGQELRQRRAESWDALTYGIGGTLGPAAVAAAAAALSAGFALTALSAASFAAAPLLLALPKAARPERGEPAGRPPRAAGEPQAKPRGVLRALAAIGPLRRATLLTMAAALPGGAISVLAVAFAERTAQAGGPSGGYLVTAFGLGNLAGSLLLVLFPLRGNPEKQMRGWTAAVAASFVCCGFMPSYAWLFAALLLAGAANAPFFAAALAVRSAYSPDGIRAQAFAAMAGIKTAAGSAGTAAAGLLIGFGPSALFWAGGLIVALALLATGQDLVRDKSNVAPS
ncbi:hypothetical protein [Saccharibacillus sacchari]|uniref:Uncharacterized protein n=1 Tax=Saccharibacillus sacchari TaxID=456493 RepID=A0ACC6PDE7_9BACL